MTPPLKQLTDFLRTADSFLVTSHVAPDGDAMGSMIAVGEILLALGKEVVLYNASGLPERFQWLIGSQAVLSTLPQKEPDVVVVLDCGDPQRTGPEIAPWLKSKTVINIDHHLDNPLFGTVNWIDPRMSSVGEMVGILAMALQIPLAGLLGQAVYLAIISDTGNFSFSNTRPETLEMAAEILRFGLRPGTFHEEHRSTGSLNRLRMRGIVLHDARLYADGRISLISFSQRLFDRTETTAEDTEGLVNTVLYVQGVQIAISLREEEYGVKFSLRSKGDVNIQPVAASFGGGGHRNASGGILKTSIDEACYLLVEAATKVLDSSQ